jgi:hypothetical protein
MDKATTSAVLGTILGLAAGVGGMLLFGAPKDDGRAEEQQHRIATLESDHEADRKKHETELGDLRKQLEEANRKAKAGADFADELAEKTRAKGEAEDQAKKVQAELDDLNLKSAEQARQDRARIEKLEGVLAEHGITEHLSDKEIAERLAKAETAFNTAFSGKDKKAAMEALWDIQKLGPRAYDKTIDLWKKMADDWGLNPWGGGPKELGMTEQDYVSLIRDWGLVEKGLTDPGVMPEFRIASIYGTPWWATQDPGERAKLLGNVLLASSGYEGQAAIDSLGRINSPATVRYLGDYVAQNRDNPENRKKALTTLAGKDTPEAWAAIEDAAKNDQDESVRKFAQQLLDGRTVTVAGLRITFVDENSQGALAGIKLGDILTHYNGERVKNIADVNTAKGNVGEGQSVKIIVRRGDADVTLTLGPGTIGINGVSVAPKE